MSKPFEDVDPRLNFPNAERDVLKFWDERKIYQQSLEQRKSAKSFVFFEGPPTANGMPHPGHCLTRVIKDIFPRYFTMRGFRCERKAGWDTHGLPVEVEVGKELGIHSKEEIEAYGVEPFVRKCIDSVFKYTREWEELTRRIGFWVDLDDAYVTYHQSFVESVWWALATLHKKGVLYQGHKVVWWWCQGGTALSAGEMGDAYREVDDPSVYVRFRISKPSTNLQSLLDASVPTSFLAWTTTPWTLPSNVALAVKDDVDYVVLDFKTDAEHERFVLAEALVEKVFSGLKIDLAQTTKVVGKLKGADLVGSSYTPVFNYAEAAAAKEKSAGKKIWELATADFVTLDAGTGIVHCAPAFGEDDYRFCAEHNFAFLQLIKPDGKFVPEATDVAGVFCKDADKKLVELLRASGALLKRENYRHNYPFCPRAEKDPLIQYARQSWFIRTTQFKEDFLANNALINWLPDHIKEGRFGDFLKNNVDWALSRERYWGTPLPIWQCEKTGKHEAISSYAELLAKPNVQGLDVWEKAKQADPALPEHLKVHKPYIDSVTYESPFAPGARMKRVSEVIDCWFDSGSMPFAQWGWPHQNQEKFPTQFPADFISEAIDQTRGWFYSQVAIATMLRKEFPKDPKRPTGEFPTPFKTCIVLGHLLGEDGKKMSKRLKNYREPTYIFDKYGADALRWNFLSANAPWNSNRFQEAAIQESQREFLIRLHNVYSFFVIYANIDGYSGPSASKSASTGEVAELDRWILSELHQTLAFVTEKLDGFLNQEAAIRIHDFVDALSNWYVRRSRERFWAKGMEADKVAAYDTLYECLTTLAKMLAPFTPFYAEMLYQNLVRRVDKSTPESVHLCDWPTAKTELIDSNLVDEMNLIREVVSVGRSARVLAKLKVRQPLRAVELLLADHRLDDVVKRHAQLIADELNVKSVELAERADDYVSFQIKPNLKVLGPRLGANLGKLTKWLGSADGSALRNAMLGQGSVEVNLDGAAAPIKLDANDLLVTLQAKPGFAAAEGKRVVAVLATEVSEELRLEGVAREIVHYIQGMRKELNLAFDQRIRLSIVATGDIDAALTSQASYIKSETLATELIRTEMADSAHAVDVTLDEGTATIALQLAEHFV